MILLWSLMALMSGAGPAGGVQQDDQDLPGEYIVVDGAKEPWLLPEWLVWEGVFGGVHIIRTKRMEGSPLDALAVTPAEMKRLEKAAFWYNDHFHACAERQEKEVARLRAARRPDADVFKRQGEVILKCREQVLDRADALLRGMSDRSRVALLAYVESKKKGMWYRVAKSNLDWYRRPR